MSELMATTTKCVNGHEMPTDKHYHACPQCDAGHASVAIEPRREMFPMAGVPGATDLTEVIEAWKERGLEAEEISRADTLQQIVTSHDPLNGQLTWKTSGPMDALMAVWLAVNTAISIGEYFTQGTGRVDMPTGEVVVIMGFKNGRLSIAQPEGNQLAAEKLLTNVLRYFWARSNGNPVERFAQAFGWEEADGRDS